MIKKTFIFSICICISICCVACSFDTDSNIKELNLVQNNREELCVTPIGDSDKNRIPSSDNKHPDVPYILDFDSFDEIAELSNILDEEEDVIKGYLDSTGFSMNGISSKEDIIDLFDQIGDLCLLHLEDESGYELLGVSYYISYGYLMSTYRDGNEIVRFICYVGGDAGSIGPTSTGTIDTEVVSKLTIMDKTVKLHRVEASGSPFSLIGSVTTSNSQITILLSNNEPAREIDATLSKNANISTLREIIQKYT